MCIIEVITIINLIVNITLLIGIIKLYYLFDDKYNKVLILYNKDIEPTILRIEHIEHILLDIPSNIGSILIEEPIKLERTLGRKIHEIWKRLNR